MKKNPEGQLASFNGQGGHKQVFTLECVEGILTGLIGEVLTVVDASIPTGNQNRCTKSLIKKSFWKELDLVRSIAASEDPDGYGKMDSSYPQEFLELN